MLFEKGEIDDLFTSFSSMKILVLGDVMLDAYLLGEVSRISPEAPVPIVEIHKKEVRLGGAANVALNLCALGAEVVICSVVGNDVRGGEMLGLIRKRGFSTEGIILKNNRLTTCKTRVISGGQQMLRVDEERSEDLDLETSNELLALISKLLAQKDIDAIIFEDYNKGVLTSEVITGTMQMANVSKIPTAVDPKKNHFFGFRGCTLFKPNLKELQEGSKKEIDGSNISDLIEAVVAAEKELENEYSLVTLSEYGVFIKHRDEFQSIAAHKREILDVSGAGDTVIAVATLALATKCNAAKIAALSNLAGGLVCEKVGVVPIGKEQLIQEAQSL